MRLIALPDVQENSDKPCDTGSDLEILQEEFGRDIVDLGLVFEGWNNKASKQTDMMRMSNQLTPR